ncbi:MAG: hypothetical protein M1813_004513 [Trichoglossum hirsutum]|nr:MAG: hypothetical protein M1813_004513 [Trichoglossum hirsutum]
MSPPSYAPPQFATFDSSHKGTGGKPVNEDALPAMPTWETARTRKVLEEVQPSHKDHGDDMELGDLNYQQKAAGSRVPILDHAAPPAGYEIGVATPMQGPNGSPQGRRHGTGHEGDHDPLSPYGEPQGFGGEYRRLETPNLPRGQAHGGSQHNPEGTYQQDPYSRLPHSADDHRDNIRNRGPPYQSNAGGYDGTQPYGQREDFQPQFRQNDSVLARVNTKSPPAYQNGGFSSRSPPPFNQNSNSYNRGNFHSSPVQRQNTGGYASNAQQPFPKVHPPSPIDIPDFTAGPKNQIPPPGRQNTPGADGRSYRAYTPSPASPTYAAHSPPRQQKQHPTWTVV